MLVAGAALALGGAGLAACGSGGGGPNGPTPSTTVAAQLDPATTIMIETTGVSPKEIVVPIGGRAAFMNHDNVFHEMMSDPHPVHTLCPEINAVGALAPGAVRQTAAFTQARTCTYHDHGQDSNTALHGRIVVR